jgi:hypothetical protein
MPRTVGVEIHVLPSDQKDWTDSVSQSLRSGDYARIYEPLRVGRADSITRSNATNFVADQVIFCLGDMKDDAARSLCFYVQLAD